MKPLLPSHLRTKSRLSGTSRLLCGAALLLCLNLGAYSAHADSISKSNTQLIDLTAGFYEADPYPSSINLTSVAGNVTNATVTIKGLNHNNLSDVQLLLVSPSGEKVLLMSFNCGPGDASGANITFSDAAATNLPNTTTNLSGNVSYKPSNDTYDPFPVGAPAGPYGATMSVFNGINPNGQWLLYVADNRPGSYPGQITGGWSLNLTTDAVGSSVTYTTPSVNQKIPTTAFGAGTISGTATDNVSIKGVKVRLSRKRNNANEFWDGTNWVSNSLTFVDADVTGLGSTSATWSLLNVPPANKLDGGQYGVRAYVVDFGNNQSAPADRFFTLVDAAVDTSAPTVTITSPTSSQVIKVSDFNTGSLSGTATDNVGVAQVQLKLQRKVGNATYYWNGTDFTTTVAKFDAAVTPVGDTSVTWQLAQAVPADKLTNGGYTLYATAIDAAGNSKTSPSRIFAIIGASAAPDAPVSDSSAGGS